MIIGGRKTLQNIPVICVGDRKKILTVLTGTTWKTVLIFTGFENLQEIHAIVPVLASASGVYFGLFDCGYVADGQERWKSGLVAEDDTTNVSLDRVCTPCSILKVKADAAATESVAIVLYGAGI